MYSIYRVTLASALRRFAAGCASAGFAPRPRPRPLLGLTASPSALVAGPFGADAAPAELLGLPSGGGASSGCKGSLRIRVTAKSTASRVGLIDSDSLDAERAAIISCLSRNGGVKVMLDLHAQAALHRQASRAGSAQNAGSISL